jgi:DNA polymerase-1
MDLKELIFREGSKVYVADTEGNGLIKDTPDYPKMTKLHSAVVIDWKTKERWDYRPDQLDEAYKKLEEADVVVGHNWIGHDEFAIKIVKPDYKPKYVKVDTLTLCKLLWPADILIGIDMKAFNAGKMPAKYIKRQSLGAWGYRMGNYKGEYDGGWEEWSPAMHDYMIQDGYVCDDLFTRCLRRLGWYEPKEGQYVWPSLPIEVEMEIYSITTEMELVGCGFNGAKAVALAAQLQNRQAELGNELRKVFGCWWQPTAKMTPKKDRKVKMKGYPNVRLPRYGKTGKRLDDYVGPPLEYYFAGAPYTKITYTEFNPSSRRHLGDRLQKAFGWKPNVFTENKQAQVDEGVIKNISSEVISEELRAVILEYFVVTKTLGQLTDGKNAWMAQVNPKDGAMHGGIDPLGTITTRATHFKPNLGQVPAVQYEEVRDGKGNIVSKSPIMGTEGGYGFECRDLFEPVTKGWELTGTDKSSLEFILLGHDLYPLDGGEFSERVCDPNRDPHAEHGELTGLGRKDTKTTGYAYIYGAGAPKIGHGVGFDEDDRERLLGSTALAGRLRWMRRTLGRRYEEPNETEKCYIARGYEVIKKFEGGITGLKELKSQMTEVAKTRGWIKSIIGHKLICRKEHAALNTRLQGSGAAVCKMWIIEFRRRMIAAGYLPRRDFNILLWVHDEMQVEHRPGLGPVVGRISNEASKAVSKAVGLRGEFRTDFKTGPSWAHTH